MLQKQPPRQQLATHEYQSLQTPAFFEKEPVNVVNGSTTHADHQMTAVLLKFVTVFILALACLAAYYGYKSSTELALVFFFATFGILGFLAWRFTVIVASGNLASTKEIRRRWNAEDRKILSAEQIYLQQLENQRLRDQHLFELEKKRIEQSEELQRLRMELAISQHRQRIAQNAISVIDCEVNTEKGKVAAAITPVRQQVIDYVYGDGVESGLYDAYGFPNPDKVEPDSGKLIHHTIPWSSRGSLKSPQARAEALTILQPVEHTPLVAYNPKDKSWYLNIEEYPTIQTVKVVIGQY